jgi:hypothetical protein
MEEDGIIEVIHWPYPAEYHQMIMNCGFNIKELEDIITNGHQETNSHEIEE